MSTDTNMKIVIRLQGEVNKELLDVDRIFSNLQKSSKRFGADAKKVLSDFDKWTRRSEFSANELRRALHALPSKSLQRQFVSLVSANHRLANAMSKLEDRAKTSVSGFSKLKAAFVSAHARAAQFEKDISLLQARIALFAFSLRTVVDTIGQLASPFVEEASKMQSSMIALEQQVKLNNGSFDKAKEAVKDLTKEGFLTSQEAAEALNRVLSVNKGISVEMARDVVRAATAWAVFRRTAGKSIGEAVLDFTKGVKEGKSTVTDNIGFLTDLSKVLEMLGIKGAELADLTTNAALAQKFFAKFLELSKDQMVNLTLAQKAWLGVSAKSTASMREFRRAVGDVIITNKHLIESVNSFSESLNSIQEWVGENRAVLSALVTGSVKGGKEMGEAFVDAFRAVENMFDDGKSSAERFNAVMVSLAKSPLAGMFGILAGILARLTHLLVLAGIEADRTTVKFNDLSDATARLIASFKPVKEEVKRGMGDLAKAATKTAIRTGEAIGALSGVATVPAILTATLAETTGAVDALGESAKRLYVNLKNLEGIPVEEIVGVSRKFGFDIDITAIQEGIEEARDKVIDQFYEILPKVKTKAGITLFDLFDLKVSRGNAAKIAKVLSDLYPAIYEGVTKGLTDAEKKTVEKIKKFIVDVDAGEKLFQPIAMDMKRLNDAMLEVLRISGRISDKFKDVADSVDDANKKGEKLVAWTSKAEKLLLSMRQLSVDPWEKIIVQLEKFRLKIDKVTESENLNAEGVERLFEGLRQAGEGLVDARIGKKLNELHEKYSKFADISPLQQLRNKLASQRESLMRFVDVVSSGFDAALERIGKTFGKHSKQFEAFKEHAEGVVSAVRELIPLFDKFSEAADNKKIEELLKSGERFANTLRVKLGIGIAATTEDLYALNDQVQQVVEKLKDVPGGQTLIDEILRLQQLEELEIVLKGLRAELDKIGKTDFEKWQTALDKMESSSIQTAQRISQFIAGQVRSTFDNMFSMIIDKSKTVEEFFKETFKGLLKKTFSITVTKPLEVNLKKSIFKAFMPGKSEKDIIKEQIAQMKNQVEQLRRTSESIDAWRRLVEGIVKSFDKGVVFGGKAPSDVKIKAGEPEISLVGAKDELRRAVSPGSVEEQMGRISARIVDQALKEIEKTVVAQAVSSSLAKVFAMLGQPEIAIPVAMATMMATAIIRGFKENKQSIVIDRADVTIKNPERFFTQSNVPVFQDGGMFRSAAPGLALLHPGEMVVNPASTRRFYGMLQQINAGRSPDVSGMVYNDSRTINVTVQGDDPALREKVISIIESESLRGRDFVVDRGISRRRR